jgi:hypothetical protein
VLYAPPISFFSICSPENIWWLKLLYAQIHIQSEIFFDNGNYIHVNVILK